jgi:hypothetical protein
VGPRGDRLDHGLPSEAGQARLDVKRSAPFGIAARRPRTDLDERIDFIECAQR